jgi:hypothetical protein
LEVAIFTLKLISQKSDAVGGITTAGLGVKITSLVPEPPAGTLLVQLTPEQVVWIVLSPSYSTRAPLSVQGMAVF